ncbi:MAG: UDP-N-acetylglucosamine 2-epimerase (non-hydrolyzing), partial [Bdellovibrionales bacterium]|nr:UDP-N-acetylglucosamine 2-epimerase (non-hydrolyzing) [Bdellovibrionales bacterium]
MHQDKKKILLVLGTRPEVIKMFPVFRALKELGDFVLTCATGQHKELFENAALDFGIPINFQLESGSDYDNFASKTGLIIQNLSKCVSKIAPSIIVAQGDTNSVFAAAYVAGAHGIKFAHVEACLRLGSIRDTYPEELNRRFCTILSDYHFAPSERAMNNLVKEGVPKNQIYLTGNPVVDSVYYSLESELTDPEQIEIFKQISGIRGKIVFFTCHRRENYGQGIINICEAIKKIVQSRNDIHFVVPMHLNPQVKEPIEQYLSGTKNIHLYKAFSHRLSIRILNLSTIVMTDSGGLQEEAVSLKRPCIVLRESTERQEVLDCDLGTLVGNSYTRILKEFNNRI